MKRSLFPPYAHRIPLVLLLSATSLASQGETPPPDVPPAISLPALVDDIARRNPERHFYQEEIAAARSAQRTASFWSDPELSFDVGRKRVRDVSGGPGGEGLAWSVSVTQTFEWPGRLALRQAIADRDVALAELGLERFEHALSARARQLAYGLHAAHAKAEAARAVAGRFADLRETFLSRDPAGVGPLLETRVIEAAELALQRRATEAGLALQAALIELNQLRGEAPAEPLRVQARALAFGAIPSASELVASALENNFEFRRRRLDLERQGYVVRLAHHERRPALSISPFVEQQRAGDRETTVGIGFSMPLPVSRRSRGAAEVAEARRRQAETSVLVAQRDLEREVLTAELAYRTKAAEAQRWLPDSVGRFREAAELADRHYRLGAVSVTTYVELQTSYLDAVEALVDTQGEALAAGLKLQELTGLEFAIEEVSP